MHRFVRRLRGLLGISAIGGGVGVLFGAAWMVVASLWSIGAVLGTDVMLGAIFWGIFGTLIGGGFGILLTALGSRRTVEEIGVWRAGMWGAVAGCVVPLGLMTLFAGGLPPALVILPALVFCAGFGGLLGSGLVAMAKRAPPGEIVPGADRFLD